MRFGRVPQGIHPKETRSALLLANVQQSGIAAGISRAPESYSMSRRPQPDVAFATRVLRQARAMTQQKLADVIEMPRSWVTAIESGRRDPTIDSVGKLAKGLKVPARTLVAISESRKKAA